MAPPDAADLALVWRCGQLLHWLWPCVWLRLVAHTSAYSSAWDAEHQYHINSQQYWESMQHTSLYTPPPLLPSPLPQVPSQEDLAALRGGGRTYCARRWPPHCCSGRDDTCSVPILDTVCYCDAFCNRTVTDCCPDFWHYCMRVGMVPEVILHPLPLPELGDSLTPNTGAPNMMGPIKSEYILFYVSQLKSEHPPDVIISTSCGDKRKIWKKLILKRVTSNDCLLYQTFIIYPFWVQNGHIIATLT